MEGFLKGGGPFRGFMVWGDLSEMYTECNSKINLSSY